MIKYGNDIVDIIRVNVDKFKSNADLCEFVGMPQKAMSDLMFRHKIVRSNSNRGKLFKLNENLFSERNSVSDYWAGFIAADGCVLGDKKTVQINLKTSDVNHLNKLCHVLELPFKPRVKEHQCRISFTSKKVCSDLEINYSIVPRKSKIYNTKYFSRDFIRGYFDGDGCVYKGMGSSVRVSVAGSYSFIESLSNNLPIQRFSISKRDNIKVLQFGEASSLSFLVWLYSDCEYFLERKKNILDWCISGLSIIKSRNLSNRMKYIKSKSNESKENNTL